MRGHMRLIRKFSFAGDTVLDPPAGTGSTAVAAERHPVSIEGRPPATSVWPEATSAKRSGNATWPGAVHAELEYSAETQPRHVRGRR